MPQFETKHWRQLLDVLKHRHASICRQWFYDDLTPGRLDNGLLEIHTATPVQQNYLQKRCLEPFTEAVQEVTGQLVAARFVCEPLPRNGQAKNGQHTSAAAAAQPQAKKTPSPDPASGQGRAAAPPPPDRPEPRPADLESNLPPTPRVTPKLAAGGPIDLDAESMVLSPDYAFDHFISGPNNQLALAASVAVANQPGTAYNPLFIHGGVGLGKTHLLQAICQAILARNPQTQILYVSCDAFMSQFIACVQAGKMSEFRHRYRHVDLLVIDDIHCLAHRERSQEEFFHTFNELYQSQRQIVLSSDAAPHEIPHLEDRLVSRFSWGLVAPVTKPGLDTRIAILKAKTAMRGFDVPDDVIEFVARKVDTNARELEGAINTLQGHAQLMKRDVDLTLAREALGEPAVAPQTNRSTLQHIVDVVTAHFDVKLQDLQSRRRYKSITEPRHVCMWLVRKKTRFSLEEIGGYFGGRDHTTVMHAVDVVNDRIDSEDGFKAEVHQLLARVEDALGQTTA
ncbi:MAG: chromosomal replication initiator protein DnaA [Planctomycetota bacterium]